MQECRELWIDLEDTVITPVLSGWWNTEVINRDKVRHVIDTFKPDRVNLFSFAIWNHDELQRFNAGTRPMLETALGIKLNLVLTVDDDIIPICCRQLRIQPSTVDFQEMSNFWGKQGAFRHYMRHHAWKMAGHDKQLIAMLLDDAVFDELIEWPDLKTKLIIANIDQLTC